MRCQASLVRCPFAPVRQVPDIACPDSAAMDPATDTRLVYITASSCEEAQALARALLEAHLVACVNILPEVESLYRWEGAIQTATECVLFAKTVASRLPQITELVHALHSYATPAVVAFALDAGSPSYLNWVAEASRGQ